MKLVLGTVQFGLNYGISNSRGRLEKKEIFELLDYAYDSGITELDTADGYGNSCDILGEYLEFGKKFHVMSKFILADSFDLKEYLSKSLDRLKLDSLEGYYFHHFKDYQKYIEKHQINPLESSKHIGLSVYSLEELNSAVDDDAINIIQLPFNIFDCSAEKVQLLKKAKLKGKLIYVRSAFLQGLFFKDPTTLKESLSSFKPSLENLNCIAESTGFTVAELALGFCLQQSFIDKVLIGVDSIDQLKSNLKVCKMLIPEEVLLKLSSIGIENKNLLNPGNW